MNTSDDETLKVLLTVENFVKQGKLPAIKEHDIRRDASGHVIGFSLGPYMVSSELMFVAGMRDLLERMGVTNTQEQNAKIFETGVDPDDYVGVNVVRVLNDYFDHIELGVDIESKPFGQGGGLGNGFYLEVTYDHLKRMIATGYIDKDDAQVLDL